MAILRIFRRPLIVMSLVMCVLYVLGAVLFPPQWLSLLFRIALIPMAVATVIGYSYSAYTALRSETPDNWSILGLGIVYKWIGVIIVCVGSLMQLLFNLPFSLSLGVSTWLLLSFMADVLTLLALISSGGRAPLSFWMKLFGVGVFSVVTTFLLHAFNVWKPK